jgi:hypothetical protein
LTLRETAGQMTDRLRGQPYHGPDTVLRELLHDAPFQPTLLGTINGMVSGIGGWFSAAENEPSRKRHAEQIFMQELREAERLLDELRFRFARPLTVAGLSKPVRELHDQCFRARANYDRLIKSSATK